MINLYLFRHSYIPPVSDLPCYGLFKKVQD
jgi:hypothetical protein